MEQFFVLTVAGKITDVKPYNPFHQSLIDLLNQDNLLRTQAEIMSDVLLTDGVRMQLQVAHIPNTTIPAINPETDTVLHHLILVK